MSRIATPVRLPDAPPASGVRRTSHDGLSVHLSMDAWVDEKGAASGAPMAARSGLAPQELLQIGLVLLGVVAAFLALSYSVPSFFGGRQEPRAAEGAIFDQ